MLNYPLYSPEHLLDSNTILFVNGKTVFKRSGDTEDGTFSIWRNSLPSGFALLGSRRKN